MGGRDFEDLDVYKLAREFRKMVYRLADALPEEEKYGLRPQMKRAGVSVTNNIAEGHGRYTFRENIRYLHVSRGSVYELRDDFNTCEDEQYFTVDQLRPAREMAVRLTKVTDGYVRYLRSRQPFRVESTEPFDQQCQDEEGA